MNNKKINSLSKLLLVLILLSGSSSNAWTNDRPRPNFDSKAAAATTLDAGAVLGLTMIGAYYGGPMLYNNLAPEWLVAGLVLTLGLAHESLIAMEVYKSVMAVRKIDPDLITAKNPDRQLMYPSVDETKVLAGFGLTIPLNWTGSWLELQENNPDYGNTWSSFRNRISTLLGLKRLMMENLFELDISQTAIHSTYFQRIKRRIIFTYETAADRDLYNTAITRIKDDTRDLTDFEIFAYVARFIGLNLKYEGSYANTEDPGQKYLQIETAAEVLARGKQICVGFAMLMADILSQLGFTASVAVVKAHDWHAVVRLDYNGKVYLIEPQRSDYLILREIKASSFFSLLFPNFK